VQTAPSTVRFGTVGRRRGAAIVHGPLHAAPCADAGGAARRHVAARTANDAPFVVLAQRRLARAP